MTPQLSRRDAIKAAVLAATALFAPGAAIPVFAQDGNGPYDPGGRVKVDDNETISYNEKFDNPPLLGRSESWRLRIVKEVDERSDLVRSVKYDEVLPIYKSVHGKAPAALENNDIYFDVGEGYIHSSYVVPVHEVFQEPEEVSGDGFWGEISVPTSWQHWEPKLRSRRFYDLAYSTVYRVIDRSDEEDGRAWYRIVNDLSPRDVWWAQARHVRRIDTSEFEPISPNVPADEKSIKISIGDQLLRCFEGEQLVFATRIASGASFFDAEGQIHSFGTPWGKHSVMRKSPSRHMIGGQLIDDIYDLPGVPWSTFFTDSGAAIHGTYWHNDYGHPRSHGCVNVTSDAAKWIYRWVNPYTGYDEDAHWTTKEENSIATAIDVGQ